MTAIGCQHSTVHCYFFHREFDACPHDVYHRREEFPGWLLCDKATETETVCAWTLLLVTGNIRHRKQEQ